MRELKHCSSSYQRDGLGRITHIHLPEGATLSQRYNGQGRIEAISLQPPAAHWWERIIRWVWAEQGTKDLITGVQHSASLGLQGYQHGNGSQAGSSHDKAGRLVRWSDGPLKTELGFNEHAQLTSLKTAAPQRLGPTLGAAQAQRERSLGYDAFGRLRQVSQAGQQAGQGQSFEYDGNGNRIGQRSD